MGNKVLTNKWTQNLNLLGFKENFNLKVNPILAIISIQIFHPIYISQFPSWETIEKWQIYKMEHYWTMTQADMKTAERLSAVSCRDVAFTGNKKLNLKTSCSLNASRVFISFALFEWCSRKHALCRCRFSGTVYSALCTDHPIKTLYTVCTHSNKSVCYNVCGGNRRVMNVKEKKKSQSQSSRSAPPWFEFAGSRCRVTCWRGEWDHLYTEAEIKRKSKCRQRPHRQ